MTIPAEYAFTFWGARVACMVHVVTWWSVVTGWHVPGWSVVTVWGGSIRVTVPGRYALLGDVHTVSIRVPIPGWFALVRDLHIDTLPVG